jgi:hypothetical protein
MDTFFLLADGLQRPLEKVEKQIPRRPEGLLVMTKQKTRDGAAEAAPLQNIPQSTLSAASSAGGSVSSA